jgi:hypothetical protein
MGNFTAYKLGMNSACKKVAFYELLQRDLDRKLHAFWSLENQPLDTDGRILIMLKIGLEETVREGVGWIKFFRLGCITSPL